MAPFKAILLSGIPGSGKTKFAHWLRDQGWIIVESDPFYRGASPKNALEEAWVAFLLRSDPQRLQPLIADGTAPILIEWGFPVIQLSKVNFLMQIGMEGWWFDGDTAACHAAWRQVHSGADEQDWNLQVPSIRRARRKIAAMYGERIVRVVDRGRPRLTCEQIASLMRLN